MVSTTHPMHSSEEPSGREFFQLLAKMSPVLRVLVVDDEPLIRWAIVETLRDCGCTVESAANAGDALRVLASSAPFDVVVLDFRPSDGLSLLGIIKSRRHASEVVVMTAYATPDLNALLRPLGVHQMMAKPFEMGEMVAAVLHAHLDRAH